eukprot:4364453-Prymnesium_polylepis.2
MLSARPPALVCGGWPPFLFWKARFRSHVADGLSALLQRPSDWYAARLKAAFKGWGANNRTVCRILGSLDKAEAVAVAAAYEKKYAKPLRVKIVQVRAALDRMACGPWIAWRVGPGWHHVWP